MLGGMDADAKPQSDKFHGEDGMLLWNLVVPQRQHRVEEWEESATCYCGYHKVKNFNWIKAKQRQQPCDRNGMPYPIGIMCVLLPHKSIIINSIDNPFS